MFFTEAAIFFLLGTIIASFIGVVVVRLNTGQSIWFGRSRCDVCNTPLSVQTLVPIVSHLFSGGKARCCGAKITHQSFISEVILGTLFVMAYVHIGLQLALPLVLAAISLILALVLYDLSHQILPSSLLYPFVLISSAAALVQTPDSFLTVLTTAALIAGSLASIHFISRGRAMGFADAPFAFGLSMLVGSAAFSGFIFSFWIGAISGIIILARRPKGSRMGVEVPFAPYLAAGFLLAYFTQWNPFSFIELLIR